MGVLFAKEMDATTPVELGGALNSGLSWKDIILCTSAAVVVTGAIGAIACYGKKYSELKRDTAKSRGVAGFGNFMQPQSLGKAQHPDPARQGPRDPGQEVQQVLQHFITTAGNSSQQGKHLDAARMYLAAAELIEEYGQGHGYAAQFQSSALQEF